MKTTEQILDGIIDIGMNNDSGTWPAAKKYLDDYILEIRQDQKEKCCQAWDKATSTGEGGAEINIKNIIMEADQ